MQTSQTTQPPKQTPKDVWEDVEMVRMVNNKYRQETFYLYKNIKFSVVTEKGEAPVYYLNIFDEDGQMYIAERKMFTEKEPLIAFITEVLEGE